MLPLQNSDGVFFIWICGIIGSVHLLVKVIHGQWKKYFTKRILKYPFQLIHQFTQYFLSSCLVVCCIIGLCQFICCKSTAWWGNCYCYSNYFEQQGWSNSWPGVINHSGFHRQCWPLPNVRSVGSVGLYLMCAAAKVYCCRTILGPIWPAFPRLSAWWW